MRLWGLGEPFNKMEPRPHNRYTLRARRQQATLDRRRERLSVRGPRESEGPEGGKGLEVGHLRVIVVLEAEPAPHNQFPFADDLAGDRAAAKVSAFWADEDHLAAAWDERGRFQQKARDRHTAELDARTIQHATKIEVGAASHLEQRLAIDEEVHRLSSGFGPSELSDTHFTRAEESAKRELLQCVPGRSNVCFCCGRSYKKGWAGSPQPTEVITAAPPNPSLAAAIGSKRR